MADNLITQSATPATIPEAIRIATREVAYSGDTPAHIAPTVIAVLSGADDAKVATDVSAANPLPVGVQGTVPVSGTVEVANDSGNPLPVSGTVEITNDVGNPIPVSGTVAVSGAVEVTNDAGNPLPVSGTVEVTNDLGNPLPVSGTVEITNDVGNAIPVSGPLTDTQLRATAVPISLAALKQAWGAKATVTITLASLANGSARESNVIDLSGLGALDVVLRVSTRGQGGGTSVLNLYAYAALGDATYSDGATGADAAFTAANRLNAKFVGAVQLNAANQVVAILTLAQAFDGALPSKIGLIAINNSGAALDTTGANHVLEYQVVTLAGA